jgi:hypothetical protein
MLEFDSSSIFMSLNNVKIIRLILVKRYEQLATDGKNIWYSSSRCHQGYKRSDRTSREIDVNASGNFRSKQSGKMQFYTDHFLSNKILILHDI